MEEFNGFIAYQQQHMAQVMTCYADTEGKPS